jgi:hypothetical protein
VGGGGVSRIAARLATFILLKNLSFSEAGFARLTRYAAELTRRTEYKPAARRWIVPAQPPDHAGPLPSSLVQRTPNTTAATVQNVSVFDMVVLTSLWPSSSWMVRIS